MIYSLITSLLCLLVIIYLMSKDISSIKTRLDLIPSDELHSMITKLREDLVNKNKIIDDLEKKNKKLELALEIKVMNDSLSKGEY